MSSFTDIVSISKMRYDNMKSTIGEFIDEINIADIIINYKTGLEDTLVQCNLEELYEIEELLFYINRRNNYSYSIYSKVNDLRIQLTNKRDSLYEDVINLHYYNKQMNRRAYTDVEYSVNGKVIDKFILTEVEMIRSRIQTDIIILTGGV